LEDFCVACLADFSLECLTGFLPDPCSSILKGETCEERG
jgi:hypothetical protein